MAARLRRQPAYLSNGERYQGVALGLVGALMLFSSPRIFADALYNTKDLAFLSFLVMAAWSLDRYVERPSHAWAAFHGVLCAFATDIRLAGALVVAMTLLAFPLREAERGPSGRRGRLATVLTFLCAGCAAGVAVFAVGASRALLESRAPGVPLATRADRLLLLTWVSAWRVARVLDVAVTARWMARWHPHTRTCTSTPPRGARSGRGSFDVDVAAAPVGRAPGRDR